MHSASETEELSFFHTDGCKTDAYARTNPIFVRSITMAAESTTLIESNHHPARRNSSSYKSDAEFLQEMPAAAAAAASQNSSGLEKLQQGHVLRLATESLLENVKVKERHLAAAIEFRDFVAEHIRKVSLNRLKADKASPFSTPSKMIVESSGTLTVQEGNTMGIMNRSDYLPTLDLIVYIPLDVWEHKDYMHSRYFERRNRIVWEVARTLLQKSLSKKIEKISWKKQDAQGRRPMLIVSPVSASAGGSSKRRRNFRLQVKFGVKSLDWLPPLRIVPNRCNLRGEAENSWAYNHSLSADAFQSFGFEEDELERYPNLESTMKLAKIWCLLREIEVSMPLLQFFFVYLYRTNLVSPRVDPGQALMAWWKLLSQTNWLGEEEEKLSTSTTIRVAPSEAQSLYKNAGRRQVLVMPLLKRTAAQTIGDCDLANLYAASTRDSPLSEDDPSSLLDLYSTNYKHAPVLLTHDLCCNVLGDIAPRQIRWMQQQAKKALNVWQSKEAFNLLIQNLTFWEVHDAYLPIPLKLIDWKHLESEREDLGPVEAASRRIVRILRKACGDRLLGLNCCLLNSNNMDGHPLTLGSRSKLEKAESGQIVLGLRLNPDTCWRVVDRGPPADDARASRAFVDLWGTKAALRRFKDGAIVHAVVWDNDLDEGDNVFEHKNPYIRFQNADKVQGGTVERIVRHILKLHCLDFQPEKPDIFELSFSLRNMQSLVDTAIISHPSAESIMFDPLAAHRAAMRAFDSLAEFLKKNSALTEVVAGVKELQSKLGLPLPIDNVEALSMALRYSEIFPPVPHPFLGSQVLSGTKKVTGAIMSAPIEIQIRFGSSSKWPADIKAVGAAKTAMLLRLVEGIESLKRLGSGDARAFDGPVVVTPSYADIGFKGYVFRIYVRADPELRLLRGLAKPTSEAVSLSTRLHHRHVVEPMHHSLVHSVFTSNPSSSFVVRITQRWVSSHCLSDLLPKEVVELLVCSVYSERNSVWNIPATVVSGFLRVLKLLCTHDWVKEPLVVDPNENLGAKDHTDILAHFEITRGKDFGDGPSMFIVAPYNRFDAESDHLGEIRSKAKGSCWTPSFAAPERMVALRLTKLAERTWSFLQSQQRASKSAWSSAFQESPSSFRSYSVLLRVDSDLLVNPECSSTGSVSLDVRIGRSGVLESSYSRSMHYLNHGPRELRKSVYRNLSMDVQSLDLVLEWNPVPMIVRELRSRLGRFLVVFYNELCPEVIGVLWRPIFTPRPFSALSSEYACPLASEWSSGTLMSISAGDLLREMSQISKTVVVDAKVFDQATDNHNC